MKRIRLFIYTLTLCYASANADGEICKIKGSTDNSSVEIGTTYLDGTTVKGELLNDSESTNANITIEVEGIYRSGSATSTLCKQVRKISVHSQSVPFEVSFPVSHPNNSNYKFTTYRIVGISGNKCE